MANQENTEVDAVSGAQPMYTAKEKFIASVYPYAVKSSNILKDQGIIVDPRSIVSQWSHETGYGTNTGTQFNNLAGMFAYQGSPYGVNGKQYETLDDFVIDYTATLSNDRYSGINNTGDDVTAFASALKSGGYATDVNYAYSGNWLEAFNIASQFNVDATNVPAVSTSSDIDVKWFNLYRYDQEGNKVVVPWKDFFLGKTIEWGSGDGVVITDHTYDTVNEANGGTTQGQTTLVGDTPDNWFDIVKVGIFQLMIFVLVVVFLYASLIKGSAVGDGIEKAGKSAVRVGKAVATSGASEVV